jgi:hypothetical protein
MKREKLFNEYQNQVDKAKREKPVYQVIASKFDAYVRCVKTNNTEWIDKHYRDIEKIVKNYLPYGSGIDSGVTFDFGNSTSNKLVFDSSYHCMNDNGYYDGWIDFRVILKPSLQFGFVMQIIGRFSDRHYKYESVRDYMYEEFEYAFGEKIKEF